MKDNVVVYTFPGCPDCEAVKNWLKKHSIAYTEIDITNPGMSEEVFKRFGVRIAPITVVNDQVFYGTFKDQKENLEKTLNTL